MSTQKHEAIPQWTLGDRLRKARSLTGLNTRDFAAKIGVSHGTVTNAETDARGVREITIKQWALVTGVSETWLRTGEGGAGSSPPPITPSGGPRGGIPAPDSPQMAALAHRSGRGHASTSQYSFPAAA